MAMKRVKKNSGLTPVKKERAMKKKKAKKPKNRRGVLTLQAKHIVESMSPSVTFHVAVKPMLVEYCMKNKHPSIGAALAEFRADEEKYLDFLEASNLSLDDNILPDADKNFVMRLQTDDMSDIVKKAEKKSFRGQRKGSRIDVMRGRAEKTAGGLKREDFSRNKRGKMVHTVNSLMRRSNKKLFFVIAAKIYRASKYEGKGMCPFWKDEAMKRKVRDAFDVQKASDRIAALNAKKTAETESA